MKETRVQSLGQEDPLEEEMAIHSNILAWEIPWMEDPDGLQSMRQQKKKIKHHSNQMNQEGHTTRLGSMGGSELQMYVHTG